MTQSNQCILCGRFWGGGKCEAYPVRIPEVLFFGQVSHDEPYPGDGGKLRVAPPADIEPPL